MDDADKRMVILSGGIGIGKSTVCQKVAEIARNKGLICGGIITRKAGDSDILIEDIKTGAQEILASEPGKYSGPRIGRYTFNPLGLLFGITAIERGVADDILFIDELGHLEVKGEGFAEAFNLLDSDDVSRSLVVIREELLSILLPRFARHPKVFRVTIENRDTIAEQIMLYFYEHEAPPSSILS